MKRRNKNAVTEREGLLAVEVACNRLNLIWRDLLQEDVGIDGTIEVAIGEYPTGKLVGVQVKSGASYIRSETAESFRFYPDKDDLQYWASVSIPMFLLVHDPSQQPGPRVIAMEPSEELEGAQTGLLRNILRVAIVRVDFAHPATAPRTFVFRCDIFCGTGHEEMNGKLTVVG